MISHARAQGLVSAQMDGSLAADDARELQLHLLDCAVCRGFADRTDGLARGLRGLPHLAPSPNVSRQVLEAVAAGRSPWPRLFTGGARLASSPVLAVAGSFVLIAALAFTIVLALDPPGGDGDVARVPGPVGEQAMVFASETAAAETAAAGTATDAPPTAAAAPTATPRTTPTPRAVVAPSVAPTATAAASTDRPSPPTAAAEPPTPTRRPNVTVTVTPTQPVATTGIGAAAIPTDAPVAPTRRVAEVSSPTPTAIDPLRAPTTAAPPPTESPAPAPPAAPTATDAPPTARPALAAAAGSPVAADATEPTDPTVTPSATAEPEPSATTTPFVVVVPTTDPAEEPGPTASAAPSPTPEPTATVARPTATAEPPPVVVSTATPPTTPASTTVPLVPPTEAAEPAVAPTIAPVGGSQPVFDEAAPTSDAPANGEEGDLGAPVAVVVDASAAEPAARFDSANEPGVGLATPVDASLGFGAEEAVEADRSPAIGSSGAGGDAPAEVERDDAVPADRARRRGEGAGDDGTGEAAPTGGVLVDASGAAPPIVAAEGTTPVPIDGSIPGGAGSDRPPAVAPLPDDAEETVTPAPVVPDETPADADADGDGDGARTAAAPDAERSVASEAAARPVGALPDAVGGDVGVAVVPDGTVATETGSGVSVVSPSGGGATLDGATAPVWSPRGGVLLVSATFPGNPSPTAAIWDRASGQYAPLTAAPSDGQTYRDLPAGWSGTTAFYRRIYGGASGRVELRAYEVTGPDDRGVVWSAALDRAGAFGGEVGAARVSPDGARIAYVSDGQFYVASVVDPAGASEAIPAAGMVGFAWSPAGDRLVVSDGATLTLRDAGGAPLGAVALGGTIGAPVWGDDGLYVPLLGGSATVVRVDPDGFLA